MLELVNLSNYPTDNEGLIHNSPKSLGALLKKFDLDGIELMLCQPWDQQLHRGEWVKGVHLRFWPDWLDFYCGNNPAVEKFIGDKAAVKAYYGAMLPVDWIRLYRKNIRAAVSTPAEYMVFHIANAHAEESYCYRFEHSSEQVVKSAVALINSLTQEVPADTCLLFENLWWPGLTFLSPAAVSYIVEHVEHKNIGFMLDTGHLMNTNRSLETQVQAARYVEQVIDDLGSLKQYIKGIHLHQSLSGTYVKNIIGREHTPCFDKPELMNHILNIDQHQPFTENIVRDLVASVEPEYLVHEFIQYSRADWERKLAAQKKALTGRVYDPVDNVNNWC